MISSDRPDASPHRLLWLTALQTAIDDAVFGVSSIVEREHARRLEATARARAYILKPDPDFDLVCHLAGLDSEHVRSVVRLRIAERAGTKIRPKADARLYTFRGETLSLTDWSVRTGIPKRTLIQRRRDGWPVERMLAEPPAAMKPKPAKRKRPRGRPGKIITHEGQTLPLGEWANRAGLTNAELHSRLSQGWTVERAIATPIRRRNRTAEATAKGPGVVSDFAGVVGTGGGTTEQDCNNITFSSEAVE